MREATSPRMDRVVESDCKSGRRSGDAAILFVSPQLPWPLDVGSRIRIYNLLKSYAEIGRVTLVCFVQDESEAKGVAEIERQVERLLCLPLSGGADTPIRQGKTGAIVELVERLPKIVRYFRSRRLREQLRDLLDEGGFDIVHVERIGMTGNVDPEKARALRGGRPLWVLDVDDMESEKMRRTAAMMPWSSPRKYFHLAEYFKLRSYELQVMPKFDCVLVCSDMDRTRLPASGQKGPAAVVFQNGADIKGLEARPIGNGDGKTIVFLGAMNYQPNEDAVVYFHAFVLPLIRKTMPDVRFVIAGKSPSEKVRAFANDPGVEVTGYLEETKSLFQCCTVFVVPIRIGGGTRIKILEAMANGKAVVSTTVGCEGIDVHPGIDILIGDTPDEIAGACVDLLTNEDRRARIAEAGHSLVNRKYRWEGIRASYANSLKAFLHQGYPLGYGKSVTGKGL